MSSRIEIYQGDITTLEVDAIVNAANVTLLGGAGVDGAIHSVAGPLLLRACRQLSELRPGMRCPTGEARLTLGFGLPARHVIHTVGPIWYGGERGEPELLARCYRNSLMVAMEHDLKSIAFPAISCGVYGYPTDKAAEVAVSVVREHVRDHPVPHRIIFCCFGVEAERQYRKLLPGVGR